MCGLNSDFRPVPALCERRCDRVDREPARHDRLDRVTRPRPPIGPAMAGAVDLSGLKQRAQQNSSATGPAGRATSAQPGGPQTTEVTEANFEAEVLVRSDEVPVVVALWSPRSDACVDLIDTLSA